MPEQQTERLPTTLLASGILSTEIDSVWDQVKPLIEPAIFENEFSIDEVYRSLKERTMQLWVAHEGKIILACVTRIDIANIKYLNILFLGGERFSECSHFINLLSDFAKSKGCSEIRTLSRKGFGRFLLSSGFENPLRLFRKKIYG